MDLSKWPPQAAKQKITISIRQKFAGWPLDFPAADRNRLAAPKPPISIARSLTVFIAIDTSRFHTLVLYPHCELKDVALTPRTERFTMHYFSLHDVRTVAHNSTRSLGGAVATASGIWSSAEHCRRWSMMASSLGGSSSIVFDGTFGSTPITHLTNMPCSIPAGQRRRSPHGHP